MSLSLGFRRLTVIVSQRVGGFFWSSCGPTCFIILRLLNLKGFLEFHLLLKKLEVHADTVLGLRRQVFALPLHRRCGSSMVEGHFLLHPHRVNVWLFLGLK